MMQFVGSSSTLTLTQLSAKKNKKKRSTSGEGFGKRSSQDVATVDITNNDEDTATSTASPRALQSIETSTPQQQTQVEINLDPNLSPEERSQAILREKFGLKSYEEQQADLGDYKLLLDAEKKKEKRTALRNLDKVWPEDKDFVQILPPSLIKGIDTALKVGLGISTVAFILAGILITWEAGSKATGKPMPGELQTFIVDVIQPNFTPGLGVLLAFSVTLGVFSIGIGSSASSTYKEKP